MPLFGSSRDISLIRSLNRELINKIIEQKIGYYKILLESPTNVYGESPNGKSYTDPVLINCLVDRGDMTNNLVEGLTDVAKIVSFRFLRDDLTGLEQRPGHEDTENYNIVPEKGDIVLFNGDYYEVDLVNENQFFVGKNPDYSYHEDTDAFGTSLSIIVTAHYTRPEKVGLEPQR